MAGVCIHEGFRCWACMYDSCYDGPTYHVWFDDIDTKAYQENNTELPTGPTAECGCYYCGRPAIARQKLEADSNKQGT